MFLKSLSVLLISGCLWNCLALVTQAQIIPDNTLNSDRSVVIPNTTVKDAPADYLEGGAIEGNNLFHSFSEFNVIDQGRVYFASPAGIQNILTRVTGNNLSNISGTLGVDGSANLFLLNPNGIVFGQNSQLDIAGSFLATTADSYIFDNGFSYGARSPKAPPLLTVNIPVGLQFGSHPQSIINRSGKLLDTPSAELTDKNTFLTPEGLRLAPQQTLSLIGGEIIIEGGYINTAEGNIELGGVGAENQVKLIPQGDNWQTDYAEVKNFADIKINQQGGIDGGDRGNSQITLTGKNISLGYDLNAMAELGYEVTDFFSLEPLSRLDELTPDQTQITAHNLNHPTPSRISVDASDTFSIIDPGNNSENFLAHTSGAGNAGDIDILADSIIMYGATIESWTLAGATGNSGKINFTAQNMSVQNGGGGVNSFSEGQGGLINLDIAENLKIQFGGFGADARNSGNSGIIKIKAHNLEIKFGGLGVPTYSTGKGGTIELKIANELKITSGGFGADAFDRGNGGKIKIDAQNIEFRSAGMGANTRGEGKGGEIEIKAESILFQDGIIGAESGQNLDERDFDENGQQQVFNERNAGNGGNISIVADSLLIDNSNITNTTFGTGNAGEIELQVNSLEAIGGDLVTGINSSTDGAGSGGNIAITSDRLNFSDGAKIAANSTNTGQAGDVWINAHSILQLQNQGTISVDGGTAGTPGNINIRGKDIILDRGGKISATTTQGTQGNINLRGNFLFLRDRSEIVTNATQDATGGNIFIYLKDNLLGLENSQITANAERGSGGNIQITTKGIFLSADSQINASSEFGIDGLIQIDTLAVDPNSGLIKLPTELIDPSLYLSQGCIGNKDNQFVSIGRGGLPENPFHSVIQDSVLPDWGTSSKPTIPKTSSNPHPSTSSNINHIIEAQNWKINQNGKVELFAVSNKGNPSHIPSKNRCLNQAS